MDKKKESIEERINRIVTPIFDKVLSEIKPDSMTTIKNIFKIFFRPHNYRRKIEIKSRSNSTIVFIYKSAIPKKNINYVKHTKLLFIKDYHGVTIQYAKNTITAIYSQKIIEGVKETFLISAYSPKDLCERIYQLIKEIQEKMDNALRIFCKEFNIEVFSLYPVWDRYENFIKGEEYIDSIPTNCIIHDTFFKKVYGEGIEFKQTEKKEDPGVHIKNYIKNRAIEDVAPEIINELNKIGTLIEKQTKSMQSQTKLQEVQTEKLVFMATNQESHAKMIIELYQLAKNINKKFANDEPKKPTKKPIKKPIKKIYKYGLTKEEMEKIKEL